MVGRWMTIDVFTRLTNQTTLRRMKQHYTRYRSRWDTAYSELISGISERDTVSYVYFIQTIDSTMNIHYAFNEYFQAFNTEIKRIRKTNPNRVECIHQARTQCSPKLFELHNVVETCDKRETERTHSNPFAISWLRSFKHSLWGMTNENDRIFLTCLLAVAAMTTLRTALIDYAWRFSVELSILVERYTGEAADIDVILSEAYLHPSWLRAIETCRQGMSDEGLKKALQATRNLRIRTF